MAPTSAALRLTAPVSPLTEVTGEVGSSVDGTRPASPSVAAPLATPFSVVGLAPTSAAERVTAGPASPFTVSTTAGPDVEVSEIRPSAARPARRLWRASPVDLSPVTACWPTGVTPKKPAWLATPSREIGRASGRERGQVDGAAG